jgi:hypothetical protein
MEGPYKERWQQLCKQVADEKDPARFQELVQQLIEELNKKDDGSETKGTKTPPDKGMPPSNDPFARCRILGGKIAAF